MAMLEVKDLEVYYGMIQAIKGISFEVNQGEVIALIGANGAGKTSGRSRNARGTAQLLAETRRESSRKRKEQRGKQA